MTGITRVAKESIFSDLNRVSIHENTPVACPSHNLNVVTTTSDKYAGGYLKVLAVEGSDPAGEDQPDYTLALTNGEVRRMFRSMVRGWFTSGGTSSAYQNFLRALASGNVESMNLNLNRVTRSVFGFFDAGGQEPERFYHGFVLGLMVYLDNDYLLWSNRESEDASRMP